MTDKIRIQKFLADLGYGSRRLMESWVEAGRIVINGKPATLGDKVDSKDKIIVNGRSIEPAKNYLSNIRVILYHKPVGEISSRNDPHHAKTVFDNLPYLKQGRWVQVGRLDINTSGLLIFTNDGNLANQLMHPKFELEREYAVRVHGIVSKEMLNNLKQGVMLDDGKAHFDSISYQGGEGTNSWYHVILKEGRNREVRRLWQSQGVEVSRLIRIRYGKFTLPRHLQRGQYVELTKEEVSELLAG